MDRTNDSFVVRRVRNKPDYFKGDRVSSALFKDGKGVSVDKADGRVIEEIIADEERLHELYNGKRERLSNDFKLKAIVSVSNELCESASVVIRDQALKENQHHALLIQNDETLRLTSAQAKALARGASIVKRYDV